MSGDQQHGGQHVSRSIIGGNLTQIEHADYVVISGDRARASGYIQQVRQIAPYQLNDRDQELNELARFCLTGEDPPYLWIRAPAWAGKSALMSWFALHPPPNVVILSFFITARWQGHNDKSAFIDAILEQLSNLLDEPIPSFLTPATRDSLFFRMLAQATDQSVERGKRLVLVLDGLDEDRGVTTGPDAYSIAALLPIRPPSGLRIVVSGRPNPPIPSDVPDTHPLRDPTIVRPLIASPYAAVVKSDMQRELKRLLYGSEIERNLLGIVTAAGGGLTAKDLAYLTDISTYEVEENLHTVIGRTFSSRTSSGQDNAVASVFMLGHDELQSTATSWFGSDSISQYQERLHEWARHYQQQHWPPETPNYLLSGYFRMLQSTKNLPLMLACATDRERHDLMLSVTGGDIAALTEIVGAQEQVLAQGHPDLITMARLAVHQSRINDRNSNLPTSLPVIWALVGNLDRAEVLARSITDAERKAKALVGLSLVIAKGGDANRASAVACSIVDPRPRIEALFNIAKLIAETGDADNAEAVALLIDDPIPRTLALSNVTAILAQNGDTPRALALSHRTEAAARSIAGADGRDRVLADLAAVLVEMNDTKRADDLVLSITNLIRRGEALANLARIFIGMGDVSRAVNSAQSIPNTDRQEQVLAELSQILAQSGDTDQAIGMTHLIPNSGRRERAIIDLAITMARSRDGQRAMDLVQANIEPYRVTDVQAELVHEMAQAGDLEWAINLAKSIADPFQRNWCLADIAMMAASAGNFPGAGILVRSIDDLTKQNDLLVDLVQISISLREFSYAADFTKAITEPSRRWRAQVDLSHMLAVAGEIDQATVIARTITDMYSQDKALLNVAIEAARDGDNDRAATLVKLIADPPAWKARAMAKLAPVMAGAGEVGRAVALARTITDLDWRDQALTDVSQVIAREKGSDQAGPIIRLITDPAMRQRAISKIAQEEALMRTAARPVVAAKPMLRQSQEELVLAKLAFEAAKSGDADRATGLAYQAETKARSIKDPNWYANTLAKLASVVAYLGDTNRAVALAQAINDSLKSGEVIATVALLEAQAGNFESADRLAYSIDILDIRGQALTDLALLAAQTDQHDRANGLTELIKDSTWQGRARADLALLAAQVGDFERAGNLAQSISDPSQREQTKADLALFAAQSGQYNRVNDLIEAIHDQDRRDQLSAEVDFANTLPRISVRSISLNRPIIDLGWRHPIRGDLEKAASRGALAEEIADLIDRAQAAAQSISDSHSQAQALADLALLVKRLATNFHEENQMHLVSGRVNEAVAPFVRDMLSRSQYIFAYALATGDWEATVDALGEINPSAVFKICDEFLGEVVRPHNSQVLSSL